MCDVVGSGRLEMVADGCCCMDLGGVGVEVIVCRRW